MPSRAQVNKAHKARFSSKATRNLHKISATDKKKTVKADRHVGKGARAARLQHNKMVRCQKRAALLERKRASIGSECPPRVIVLFGLTASVKVKGLANHLLGLLSPENAKTTATTVASQDYKLRATVLEAPHGDLLTCVELAKVADLIAFVASANALSEEGTSSSFIDSFGTQCLSIFRALGLPSTVVLIRDLPLELKKRNDMKKMCMSSLACEFPEDSKFYPADTKDELHKFMWLYTGHRLAIPHWRSQRPYLMAQEVDMVVSDGNPGICTLLLSGYLRARSLSVNQLVHVSGAGDFQMCQLDVLKDPYPLNAKKEDTMDSDDLPNVQIIRSLLPDPSKQEPLLVENVPDPLAGEQTWPTEIDMANVEELQKQKRIEGKSLTHGISEYQGKNFEGTDDEDSENDDDVQSNGETDIDTTMEEDENLTMEQIQDEIRKIKDEHVEDEEFPDEVDTPLDGLAKHRFAKYRGLKSFRTSSWSPAVLLPPEYSRIFEFHDFKVTQKDVLRKARDIEQGSMGERIPVGSYARLHVKDVPVNVAFKICSLFKAMPVLASGLLEHESKMSVLHFSIKKHDSYTSPIKGKESLTFHVGFRQFVARPVFSSDSINSDKHKMEKFLHAGRFSIASVYAPISFPSLPLIVMKSGTGEGGYPAVAAVGSLKSIDPNRIILKKIILTGYPRRVSKLKATVRYMFHNPEDVKWFQRVGVWTKSGLRGDIKESVGTHGAMKCIFNSSVQQHDTVCMSLFKRTYPKWPERRFSLLDV